MTTNAVILAAGMGKRLWPHTEDRPKCLLEIGGRPLIEHQLEALEAHGIRRVTVVVGYRGDKVRQTLGRRVEYIENTAYDTTSSMYSLWLARRAAAGGCLVLNADVLFDLDILRRLLDSPFPDALAVDFDAALDEEEMKVVVKEGRVRCMSKELQQAHGENLGIVKLSEGGALFLFSRMETLLEAHKREMVPFALSAIAPEHPLAAVPSSGAPWIEIDFPHDYVRARTVVYPAIERSMHIGERPAASLAGAG